MAPQGHGHGAGRTNARRLYDLEKSELISKTRFTTLLGVGTILWGVAFSAVSMQLSDIRDMAKTITEIESRVNLLSYRQDRQEQFNRELLQNEADYKKIVQQRYDILSAQVAEIYHQRRND